jgi:hypothetical protein
MHLKRDGRPGLGALHHRVPRLHPIRVNRSEALVAAPIRALTSASWAPIPPRDACSDGLWRRCGRRRPLETPGGGRRPRRLAKAAKAFTSACQPCAARNPAGSLVPNCQRMPRAAVNSKKGPAAGLSRKPGSRCRTRDGFRAPQGGASLTSRRAFSSSVRYHDTPSAMNTAGAPPRHPCAQPSGGHYRSVPGGKNPCARLTNPTNVKGQVALFRLRFV